MYWDDFEFLEDLETSVGRFDREAVKSACTHLIEHVRWCPDIYSEESAQRVLSVLRRNRYFDWMLDVGDAFIQHGQDGPQVRRQYIQALIDQGHYTAALQLLDDLDARTKDDAPREYAESRGLRGRVNKQLYVESAPGENQRTHGFLEAAIASYAEIYRANPQGSRWHGINAVALTCRAIQDQVDLTDPIDPQEVAAVILADIAKLQARGRVYKWDLATAFEACFALKKYDEAFDWLQKFTSSSVDEFTIGSLSRQMREVWQLTVEDELGQRFLSWLSAKQLQRPAGHLTIDETTELERVFGGDFVELPWFESARRRAQTVARIESEDEMAKGTGFLLDGKRLPGNYEEGSLLLTNSHVISDGPNRAIGPDDAFVHFTVLGERRRVKKVLWSSPIPHLDASLILLNRPVDCVPCKPIVGDLRFATSPRVYIIGHPEGRPLAFSMNDNSLLDYDDRLLHYRSPTESGSSGSPIFNRDWELIGLHHKGSDRLAKLHGVNETYPGERGNSDRLNSANRGARAFQKEVQELNKKSIAYDDPTGRPLHTRQLQNPQSDVARNQECLFELG